LEDSNRTVSQRSEPNSRTTLTGEHPDPWDLLHPQEVMSRHRGAKQSRRYGLEGNISLLSPAYLSPTARRFYHKKTSGHYIRPCLTSAQFVNLAVYFLFGITLSQHLNCLEENQ